jgi:hypothetical protein
MQIRHHRIKLTRSERKISLASPLLVPNCEIYCGIAGIADTRTAFYNNRIIGRPQILIQIKPRKS